MTSNLLARALVLSGCLVLGAVAITHASKSEPVTIRLPLVQFPMQLGAWRGAPGAGMDPKVLAVLGVNDYLDRVYRSDAGVPVGLYIGYYQSQREGDTMHSPLNCLPGAGWQPVQSGHIQVALNPALNGQIPAPLEINRYLVQKGGETLLVLYWYQGHGRVVASEYWGKFYTVLDSIRMNRTDAALVRVVVPVMSTAPEGQAHADALGTDFVRTMFPLLERHLPL